MTKFTLTPLDVRVPMTTQIWIDDNLESWIVERLNKILVAKQEELRMARANGVDAAISDIRSLMRTIVLVRESE